MFKRSIEPVLRDVMTQYPIVTVTGPRQSGKTTLVRMMYPDRPYHNFEDLDTRALVESDPRRFVEGIDLIQGVILDEIQRLPQLLSYLQVLVDEKRVPGSIILTGSHQMQLTEMISQSLAGRTALLELLPLSVDELRANHITRDVNDHLLRGFFPAIEGHHLDATTHARNYIKTYVERDVRQIVQIKNLHAFQRFIHLSAGRVGSTINRESLGNEVGVSQNTIKKWLSILEASYLTLQLQPYFENFGKRAIKASKLYFTDVGLLSYVLGIQSDRQMNHDKMRGALFENMVVMDLVKYQYNRGRDAAMYFFRDSHHNEVDVILQVHDQLIPIEIKSTSTFHPSLLKNLRYFKRMVGERAPTGFLVYAGAHEQQIDDYHVVNYQNLPAWMQRALGF